MTCGEVEVLLTPYVDGELSAEETEVVEAHLRQCAACRRAAANVLGVRDLLRTAAPPAAAVAGEQHGPGRNPVRYAFAAAAAAILFAILFAPLQWTTDSPATSSSSTAGSSAVTPMSLAALDCRIDAPGPACEIEPPASFCSSARDCGLPF